jgi:hypothetical protein
MIISTVSIWGENWREISYNLQINMIEVISISFTFCVGYFVSAYLFVCIEFCDYSFIAQVLLITHL